MKHFIIVITYTESTERINEVRPKHREFLEKAYEKNIALFSGPQVPKTGGLIAAKGNSIEEIKDYFSNDPYQKEKVADYKFIEFEPSHYQDFLETWIKE